jgi:hypothetical protein
MCKSEIPPLPSGGGELFSFARNFLHWGGFELVGFSISVNPTVVATFHKEAIGLRL